MYITAYKNFIFIEGVFPEAKILDHISVTIKGAFVNTQFKTLNNIKDKLISKAYGTPANAIVQFKYGQKSTFLGSLMNRDDLVWYGEGDLAVLPLELYNQYLS